MFSSLVPETLDARITDASAAVTMEMLENTWQETQNRLDVLRAQMEHMLKCMGEKTKTILGFKKNLQNPHFCT